MVIWNEPIKQVEKNIISAVWMVEPFITKSKPMPTPTVVVEMTCALDEEIARS